MRKIDNNESLAMTLTGGGQMRLDAESETFVTHTLKAEHDGADCGEQAPTLRSMNNRDANANAGGPKHEADNEKLILHNNQYLPICPPYDTMLLQGIERRLQHGNATEADTGEIVRILREAIGEEVLQQWKVNVIAALQQTEILQSDMHGEGLDEQKSFAPSSSSKQREDEGQESRSTWAMRKMREGKRQGRSPSKSQYRRQSTSQFDANLPELPQQDPQAEGILCGLRTTREGVWILREALSAIQEMGRSIAVKGQSICGHKEGNRAESEENLQISKVRPSLSRSWLLQQARNASAQRETIRRGGMGSRMAVRRLTPL